MRTKIFWWCIFFSLFPSSLLAQYQKEVGTIVAVQGTANVDDDTGSALLLAVVGMKVFLHQTIQTQDNAKLKLVLRDNNTIVVGANSKVSISEMFQNPETSVFNTNIQLLMGSIWNFVQRKTVKQQYTIYTPGGNAGVRGTEFLVQYDPLKEHATVWVQKGQVSLSNSKGEVLVDAGFISRIKASTKPIHPKAVDTQTMKKAFSFSDIRVGDNNKNIPAELFIYNDPEIQKILQSLTNDDNGTDNPIDEGSENPPIQKDPKRNVPDPVKVQGKIQLKEHKK